MRSVPGARADEHHVRRAARDHREPPQDEGPHEDVAQLAVRLHEGHELGAVHLDHFPGLARAVSGESAPAGQDGDLPGERPDSVRDDDLLDVRDHPHRLDAAGGDHEDPPALAHFEQDLAALHATAAPMGGDPFHLRRGQPGEDVLGRGIEPEHRGGAWARHGVRVVMLR